MCKGHTKHEKRKTKYAKSSERFAEASEPGEKHSSYRDFFVFAVAGEAGGKRRKFDKGKKSRAEKQNYDKCQRYGIFQVNHHAFIRKIIYSRSFHCKLQDKRKKRRSGGCENKLIQKFKQQKMRKRSYEYSH